MLILPNSIQQADLVIKEEINIEESNHIAKKKKKKKKQKHKEIS
jgi:hypothetical protein